MAGATKEITTASWSSLPEELRILIIHHLSLVALGRFSQTCKHHHDLVRRRNASSIWRPRLIEVLQMGQCSGALPTLKTRCISVSGDEWRDLIHDALLWGQLLELAAGERVLRTYSARREDAKDGLDDDVRESEQEQQRTYLHACPGIGPEIGLTCRILDSNGVCVAAMGVTKTYNVDRRCCKDSQGEDATRIVATNTKWIEDHSPAAAFLSGGAGTAAAAAEEGRRDSLMAINECDSEWAGGFTSFYDLNPPAAAVAAVAATAGSSSSTRQPSAAPSADESTTPTFIARIRTMPSSHVGVTYGSDTYACCTAWWTMADPASAPEREVGCVRLFHVPRSRGGAVLDTPPDACQQPVWTHQLQPCTRPRCLAVNAAYVACAVEQAEGYSVALLCARTGSMLADIRPSKGAAAVATAASSAETGSGLLFDRDAGVQSLHLVRNVLLVQASGTLHAFLLLPMLSSDHGNDSTTTTAAAAVHVHPLSVIAVGDVAPLHLFNSPGPSIKPILLVRDFVRPEHVCVLRPGEKKTQRKRWYVATRTAEEPGLWSCYSEPAAPQDGKDDVVGVSWMPLPQNVHDCDTA